VRSAAQYRLVLQDVPGDLSALSWSGGGAARPGGTEPGQAVVQAGACRSTPRFARGFPDWPGCSTILAMMQAHRRTLNRVGGRMWRVASHALRA